MTTPQGCRFRSRLGRPTRYRLERRRAPSPRIARSPPNAANGVRGTGAEDAAHEVVVVSLALQVPSVQLAVATTESETVTFVVTIPFTAVTQSLRLSPTSI